MKHPVVAADGVRLDILKKIIMLLVVDSCTRFSIVAHI
jgi:hypothetical protein